MAVRLMEFAHIIFRVVRGPLSRIGAVAAITALCTCASMAADHVTLSGNGLGAHDPSSIIYDGTKYYYYSTNGYIQTRSSTNMTSWSAGSTVFNSTTLPAWTIPFTTESDGTPHNGELWAPDIFYFNGLYHLYYSASSFGSQHSAIGMATSPSLSSPLWTDQGPVIQSAVGSYYNAIDPSIFQDADGTMWMTFGSYWRGIYQVQLNSTTGMLQNPSNPGAIRLADNSEIEAAAMYRRGDYYYLFVNWGTCCQGTNSTYNIRVGRSTSVNGPFLDQTGKNMYYSPNSNNGGGTLLQEAEGKYIGPGHFEGISKSGQDYFSYHYYDGNRGGAPTLGINYLYWSADAWPTTTAPESVWVGAGAYTGNANNSTNTWTTPNNWGGKTPATGSTLTFGELVAGGFTISQNTIAGTPQYSGLTYRSDSSAYTIQGMPIRLTGPITNSGNNDQVINLNIVIDAGAGAINTGAKKLAIGGALSETGGSRSLTKSGTGELVLKGLNTYTGATNIDQGTLTIDGGDLSDASAVHVAGNAMLKVISGTPGLGAVDGLGYTTVSGAGTVLTADSIVQNTLTIGTGAKVVIRPLPGGPLANDIAQPIPEPGTFIILLIALATVLAVGKQKR